MVSVQDYIAEASHLMTALECEEKRTAIASSHFINGGGITRIGNGVALQGDGVMLLYCVPIFDDEISALIKMNY